MLFLSFDSGRRKLFWRGLGLIWAALLLIFVPFIPLSLSQAQETFMLEGQLRLASEDAPELSEALPLQLTIIRGDGFSVATLEGLSAADGGFSFADVPIYLEGHFYSVATQWAGIEQRSLPRPFTDLRAEPLDFPLYEVTDNVQEVVATHGDLRIDFTTGDFVQMLLVLHYVNIGDEIVIQNPNSAQARAFTLELPVGAFGVAVDEASGSLARYQTVAQVDGLPIPGIADTQPLVPGWPNVLRASFLVPYQDGAVIDLRFPFAVSNLGVAVREDTISVQSDLLRFTDERETTSGQVYWRYEQRAPLEPNEAYKFTLVGRPVERAFAQSSSPTQNVNFSALLLVVLGLGLLMVMMFLGLWFLRARQFAPISALEAEQTQAEEEKPAS